MHVICCREIDGGEVKQVTQHFCLIDAVISRQAYYVMICAARRAISIYWRQTLYAAIAHSLRPRQPNGGLRGLASTKSVCRRMPCYSQSTAFQARQQRVMPSCIARHCVLAAGHFQHEMSRWACHNGFILADIYGRSLLSQGAISSYYSMNMK